MSPRTASDEEKALFRHAVEHTRPRVVSPAKTKNPAIVKAGGTGLDGNTQEKLRRGALMPQARIDLHGHTEDAAHHALLAFLERARKNGLRLVLVVTGKGNPKDEGGANWTMRRHGVLKEMVPRWLNERAFAALIAGTATAHARHGGGGALYVYLRKLR